MHFVKKKPVAPPRNQRNAEPDYGNNRAPQKEKQVTFEDLLREFTGQKKEPVYDYEEEEGEADVSSYEEESYYSEEELREKEYADREEVEYKSYDEVYNVNKDFKTLDEQVDIELNKKKRFEEYKIEEQVNVHTAKRFRELLQNKDSIKDAIILKEILDRKYF